MNSIIEARKRRHERFYALDPAVRNMFHIHIATDGEENPMPLSWAEKKRERIDWAVRQYETWMKRLDWLDDDFIPYGSCVTGTEIFAEAMGCKIGTHPDSFPYAIPFVTDSSQIKDIKVPKLENSTLAYLFDMADAILARCGPGALLGHVDPQTPMDIVALIWDKNYLYMAYLDQPEAVKELRDKVTELFFAFFDEWFRRYGVEFVARCPDMYWPKGITVSEDEIGIVNTDMFNEFFLDDLARMVGRYGPIGIHCCADSRHQWQNFMQIPKLQLLNIAQHHSQRNLIKDSTKFFAGHTTLFPSFRGEDEQETWFSQLDPSAHLMLDLGVKNDEEAKRLCEKLRHQD